MFIWTVFFLSQHLFKQTWNVCRQDIKETRLVFTTSQPNGLEMKTLWLLPSKQLRGKFLSKGEKTNQTFSATLCDSYRTHFHSYLSFPLSNCIPNGIIELHMETYVEISVENTSFWVYILSNEWWNLLDFLWCEYQGSSKSSGEKNETLFGYPMNNPKKVIPRTLFEYFQYKFICKCVR